MEILPEAPVVLTKDKTFADQFMGGKIKPGMIIILPDDAILVKAPSETV